MSNNLQTPGKKRVGAFVGGDLGKSLLEILLQSNLAQLQLIAFTEGKSEILKALEKFQDCKLIEVGNSQITLELRELVSKSQIDVLFLFYWPFILPADFISELSIPIYNCHLSLLPFNRGKNPNVWPIIDGTPAGVTIHKIDSGIDSGPILFQSPVQVDILDTGKSLFERLRREMINLLRDNCDQILSGQFELKENLSSSASVNYGSRFKREKEINLNESVLPLDLLNKIRAFTFYPNESSYFYFDGRKISIRVELSEEN